MRPGTARTRSRRQWAGQGKDHRQRRGRVRAHGLMSGSSQAPSLRVEEASGPLRRLALPKAAAFGVAAVAALPAFASNTAAAPFSRAYQAQLRFSAITLTLLFTVYIVVLLGTLLFLGSLSDHPSRRPLTLAGLATGTVACRLALLARSRTVVRRPGAAGPRGRPYHGCGRRCAARPAATRQRDVGVVQRGDHTTGQALGAVAAGVLAQYAPAPTRLTWWLLLAVFVARPPYRAWLACGRSAASTCRWDRRSPPSYCTPATCSGAAS